MTLTLTPMTEAEFAAYLERLIPDYAKDNVEAGHWHESEALEKSREQVGQLLPKGVATPHHHIFVVRDGDRQIGMVWMRAILDAPIKTGFIFDIVVDEAERGKGYGRQTMQLIETKASELGIGKMELHVFSKNAVARKLYESLGYQTSSFNMIKKL